ncbi:MAG: hypothetical protein M1834_007715 [Cirrosporium novae-zelandiae]|nr:MAG: hypothetical protein M1834_007715 [Cirrosporium novae-zelandiae]
MVMTEPDPLKWTLRLKKYKTTIMLFVDKGQTFDSIKQELIDTLKHRGIADINNEPIPTSVDDIIFGVPIDFNDLRKGWSVLDTSEEAVKDGPGRRKNPSALADSPEGASLRDGHALAFIFRKDEDKSDTPEEELQWDVQVPSYDDDEQA